MNVQDVERLRRELAEYVEVEDERLQSYSPELSRGKRSLQDLMRELICLTNTEANPGICDPETMIINTAKPEWHSVERASINLQTQAELGPAGVRPTTHIAQE